MNELKITRLRHGGGNGGQNKNKVETAVRIEHIPTGIVITACSERSQQGNMREAMRRLRGRLAAIDAEKKQSLVRLDMMLRQALALDQSNGSELITFKEIWRRIIEPRWKFRSIELCAERLMISSTLRFFCNCLMIDVFTLHSLPKPPQEKQPQTNNPLKSVGGYGLEPPTLSV